MLSGMTLVSLLSILGSAECQASLSGQILGVGGREPIANVQIETEIQDTPVVNRSDEKGQFKFEKLCPGTISLRLSHAAYVEHTLELEVPQEKSIEVLLSPLPENTEPEEGKEAAPESESKPETTPDRVEESETKTAEEMTTSTDENPEEIVVQAQRPKPTETRSVAKLEGDALMRTRGKHLADTLAELPGVTVLRSGNVAKPIVRGQHGPRLLILYDGVRHEGQDWGLGHGTDIDPFSAGSLEVVKGSAGVRYGPDAIAGVLLVKPPELLNEPGIRVETQTVGALNGKRGVMAARVEGNHSTLPEFSWRVDGNYSRGAGLQTPTYPLDNTGIEEYNAGTVLAYEGDCWNLKLSFHRKSETSGVCLCVRKETTADFDAQVLSDTPPYVELYQADYAIDRPYHSVTHDTLIARGQLELGNAGDLEVTYAFQLNDRKEFEIVRVETSFAQHNFTLRSHTADVVFRHTPIELSDAIELEGMVGVSGMLQENVYRGWPLLSDYRGFVGGIFAIERMVFDGFEIEAGARFDHTTRHAYLPKKTYQSLAREERVDPEACIIGEDFTQCNRSFNATTFSLGGLAHLADGLSAKLDLSSATRAPTIDEQYLNGTSPSFPVMARGNHTLDAETSWSASATLEADWSMFRGEISAYGSFIDDYIYLAPELREDGTIRTDVLIQGSFPRFSYDPIDAIFYGAEADAVVRLGDFDFGLQGSLVRARDSETNEFLLFIPPDQMRANITYRLPETDWLVDPQISVNATVVAKQYNVARESDFAPAPDGYALVGAQASAAMYLGEGRYLVSVEVQNMLNTRYRDYTSLLRYFADEPGRQVYIRFGTEFGPER